MKKMPRIDLSIIVHEIETYPTTNPIRQKLHQVHLRKDAAIKFEVEKLLNKGFIYPVPLTEWVSNIIPIAKKQCNIRICIDFQDLIRLVPRKISLLHTSIKSSITMLGVSYFISWMDFMAAMR